VSETILNPAVLPGHSIPSTRPMTDTPRTAEWDRFGDRPMAWDDQGDRDPRVTNLTAWLWKLAALGFSIGFFLMIFAGLRLLLSV
jgi:hypothetical protein